MAISCPVCESSLRAVAELRVRNEYSAKLFGCGGCGYHQFNETPWYDECYSKPVNVDDTGVIRRSTAISKVIASLAIAFKLFNRRDVISIDYGAGYGVLVQMLEDLGVESYGYDKFPCQIFGKSIQQNDLDILGLIRKNRLIISAIEVFEHLKNPYEVIDFAELHGSTIIVSTTELIPSDLVSLDNWSYLGLDHGQHISFHTLNSFKKLCKNRGWRLYSDGRSFHVIDKSTKHSLFLFCFVYLSRIRFWMPSSFYRLLLKIL